MFRLSIFCKNYLLHQGTKSRTIYFTYKLNYRKLSNEAIKNALQKKEENTKKITPLGWILLIIPATTFGLGCWQVKRKIWKEQLIRDLEKNIKNDPISLPQNLGELQNKEYYQVKVKGKFLHDKELYVGPRSFIRPDGAETQGGLFSQQNQTNGYLVITPFKLSDRDEVILVNRGWIPKKLLDPQNRREGQINKEVEIIGVVRRGETRPQFTPDHKGSLYLYRDLTRMCQETQSYPIFIDANYQSTIQGGPVGGQTRIALRNDHLSYLITWFSLSAATSYMWYRQIFKRISL